MTNKINEARYRVGFLEFDIFLDIPCRLPQSDVNSFLLSYQILIQILNLMAFLINFDKYQLSIGAYTNHFGIFGHLVAHQLLEIKTPMDQH